MFFFPFFTFAPQKFLLLSGPVVQILIVCCLYIRYIIQIQSHIGNMFIICSLLSRSCRGSQKTKTETFWVEQHIPIICSKYIAECNKSFGWLQLASNFEYIIVSSNIITNQMNDNGVDAWGWAVAPWKLIRFWVCCWHHRKGRGSHFCFNYASSS